MGFLFTFVLGLAHLKEDKTLYTQFVKHDQHGAGAGNNLWTELAAGLHSNIMELHVQTMSTWREFRLLEQHHQLGIHIYNISGVKPHFTYHSLSTFGFTKHLYFLQIGHHVHYITNITCFIQDFRHNIWVYILLEIGCFCTFPKLVNHTLLNPDTLNVQSKGEVDKKVIYLYFKTIVVGYSCSHEGLETNARRREPSIPPQKSPSSFCLYIYTNHIIYSQNSIIMDIVHFEFIQTVNHC